jgi:hypothetical protein
MTPPARALRPAGHLAKRTDVRELCGCCIVRTLCQGCPLMAWALVDVGFHDHPKVLALLDDPDALAAIGLWTLTLAWAKGHTDPDTPAAAGQIPVSLVRRLGGTELQAKLLVRVGLWRATDDGGYVIHQFGEWQQLEAWRAKREQGRKGGRPRKPRSEPSGNHMVHDTETIWPPISQSHDMTTTEPNGSVVGGTGSRRGGAGGEKPKREPTARRLPDDFAVTREMVAWARANVPNVDGRVQTQKFTDHWKAASGANARKKDWVAAWRNWMRTADERLAQNGNGRPQARAETLDDGFWER